MIGNSVQKAHTDLVPLVKELASGGITEEEGQNRMRAWARTSGKNASKLTDAAISALEFELAEEGLAKTGRSQGEVLNDLRALQRLKAALNPPASSNERPVEEEPPPAWRAQHPNGRAFRMGDFAIFADRQPSGPWHVTVSHAKRLPALEELAVAASAVGEGLNFCALVRSGASVEPGAGGLVVHLYQANTSAGG